MRLTTFGMAALGCAKALRVEKDAQIEALRAEKNAENAALRARLESLETKMNSLLANQKAGAQ